MPVEEKKKKIKVDEGNINTGPLRTLAGNFNPVNRGNLTTLATTGRPNPAPIQRPAPGGNRILNEYGTATRAPGVDVNSATSRVGRSQINAVTRSPSDVANQTEGIVSREFNRGAQRDYSNDIDVAGIDLGSKKLNDLLTRGAEVGNIKRDFQRQALGIERQKAGVTRAAGINRNLTGSRTATYGDLLNRQSEDNDLSAYGDGDAGGADFVQALIDSYSTQPEEEGPGVLKRLLDSVTNSGGSKKKKTTGNSVDYNDLVNKISIGGFI